MLVISSRTLPVYRQLDIINNSRLIYAIVKPISNIGPVAGSRYTPTADATARRCALTPTASRAGEPLTLCSRSRGRGSSVFSVSAHTPPRWHRLGDWDWATCGTGVRAGRGRCSLDATAGSLAHGHMRHGGVGVVRRRPRRDRAGRGRTLGDARARSLAEAGRRGEAVSRTDYT